MKLDLGGAVALVTGAAGGIGQAIMEALGAAGARVVGVDLMATRDGIACDVTDRAQVDALVAQMAKPSGKSMANQ